MVYQIGSKVYIRVFRPALKYVYRKFFKTRADYLKKELTDCESVLDLGCGESSPIQYCNIPFSVGVELFDPYLQKSKKEKNHNEYIQADVRKIDFKPNSFDAVVALELLEHMSKKEGYELIKKMEKWAKRKIIVSTPNGYVYQDGYDKNPLQEHKSGWTTEDLEGLGFTVYGYNGWKRLRGYRGSIKYKPAFLWKIIAKITQKVTYYCPRMAFQLFAVKKIGN